MTTNASLSDGRVSDDEVEYLGRRSGCGFGVSITACAYVHKNGRSWQGMGVADDIHLVGLARIAKAIQAGGGLSVLQIYHGGRIAAPELAGQTNLRAPSAIPSLRQDAPTPQELTAYEIDGLIDDFRSAALRAQSAGFDGVEIHGANHYLLHQFFSPRANQRTDGWGGDLERRMKFPLAVARAVREACGAHMLVGFRITPFEREFGGYSLDDMMKLCRRLADTPLDYIHLSLDDFKNSIVLLEDRIRGRMTEEGLFEPRNPVIEIGQVLNGSCQLFVSGGIRGEADALAALSLGASFVTVGRAALIDPEWLTKVKNKREADIVARLPSNEKSIASNLTIPPRMVTYLLSRPGWIPRD